MKNKKGYFNLEQSLITVAIVVVSLILIKLVFPTLLFGVGGSAESYELTGSDVRGYITDLEEGFSILNNELIETNKDLQYWSNIDQAEEIKELQKRPKMFVVGIFYVLWLIFVLLFFVMLIKNNKKQDEDLIKNDYCDSLLRGIGYYQLKDKSCEWLFFHNFFTAFLEMECEI